MRHPDLPYLTWARGLYGRVRLDLGSSNAPTPSWEEVGIAPADVPLHGDQREGPPGLLDQLGGIYAFEPRHVAVGAGASGVISLICRATLTPGAGDHVVCETPIYGPLRALPEGLGADVTYVRRPGPGGGGRLDPKVVIDALRPDTRLVVLTSLHNPSGRRLPSPTLTTIAAAAQGVGAKVVVDEVYLEFAGANAEPAARLSPAIISVNSLTKVMGLGGLRIGWALCQDVEVIAGVRRAFLHDSVNLAAPSVAIGLVALQRREALIARARAGLAEAQDTVISWASGRTDVRFHPPDAGHMAWLELLYPDASGRALAELLLSAYSTVVAPGEFFGDPAGIRIGFGRRPEVLAEGLQTLGVALDRLT